MGGISILAILALGVMFLIIVGTVILVFVGTLIPLIVLGIRRRLGHRSRKSKIAMIILGIVCGLAAIPLIILGVLLLVSGAS
jgi:hypothetical protein